MQNNNSKILIGVLLILVGIFSIAGNFLNIPFHFTHYIFSIPGIMMLIGLVVIINHKDSFLGVVLIGVGGFWFLSRYSNFPIKQIFWEYWPVLLIIFGIYIILKREGHNHSHKSVGNNFDPKLDVDFIDEVSILSGGKRVINSSAFKGGKITSIFGGADIDLHECSLAEGTQFIDISVLFGGVDLVVPRDWKIILNVTSIFGGFDDKRIIDFNQIQESNKVLIIRGFVIFGGGDLKTY